MNIPKVDLEPGVDTLSVLVDLIAVKNVFPCVALPHAQEKEVFVTSALLEEGRDGLPCRELDSTNAALA